MSLTLSLTVLDIDIPADDWLGWC